MKIKIAENSPVGVKTYYVTGNDVYSVVHVTRAGQDKWSCDCPDFVYRRQQKKSYRSCKHILAVKEN